MMVSGSKTVRAYMTPTSSKRAWVGSKPDSSASTPKTSFPPFLGALFVTPLRPGPLVTAPAMSSRPRPSAPAPATPAAAAAPPNSTERRSNLETIGPPFRRTHRTPRRFSGDVSAQDPLRGGGTVACVSADWDLPGFSAWLGGRAAATRKAYLSDLTAFAELDVPQRRRRPRRRRPHAPAAVPGLPGHAEAGPGHHRPQGGGAALLLLLAGPAGSPRVPIRPARCAPRREAGACPACSRAAR